jgi:hypothetical protein
MFVIKLLGAVINSINKSVPWICLSKEIYSVRRTETAARGVSGKIVVKLILKK